MDVEERRNAVVIRVLGVVQGVGFRPFVYRLATELAIVGHVRNTSEDVSILAEGPASRVNEFVRRLREDAPPLARIRHLSVTNTQPQGASHFAILESSFDPSKGQLVSPDVATCDACLADIFDTNNRRYRYPFTNCTNCGPRFTIIRDMPYDRVNTTMDRFKMCEDCRIEYEDPLNRRFHAQPNACPVCGPRLTLLDSKGNSVDTVDPLASTARLLDTGNIVAIKGLGGFLLACDATSADAVELLRERKRRPAKPFAVMVRDMEEARNHCDINNDEQSLLSSSAAPIVLLRWKKEESNICEEVAPRLGFMGIMLPYTPLHHVLLRDCSRPLVMTSGNMSEEPIAADNDEALERLCGIADYFLIHDRPIHSRYDDSVMMVANSTPQFLRRARGYAPNPIDLPFDAPEVLAVGPQLKNTFCLTKGRTAFVSQHIGDLDSVETLDHFEKTINLYRHLFKVEPQLVVHDLHPDYPSSGYARQLASKGMPTLAVQHHHAHAVSCMVENGIADPVIGVAFDGAGLGTDGAIWGGEFLVCDHRTMRRAGHLEYMPLPGGDAATMRPYRTATAYVMSLLGERSLERSPMLAATLSPAERDVILRQIEGRLNTPDCSSMGRLFDAVSALVGLREVVSYEGQAAVELETEAHQYHSDAPIGRYVFDVESNSGVHIVRIAPVLSGVLKDIETQADIPTIAASFHEAVAQMAVEVCRRVREQNGITRVALSGGVFQNRLLLQRTMSLLSDDGFMPLVHTALPANDGCISLGQAAIAASSF